MKRLYILLLTVLLMMTGCQVNHRNTNKTSIASIPLPTSSNVAPSENPALIVTYSNSLEEMSLYKSKDSILVKYGSDKGTTWSEAVQLPIQDDWEKNIEEGNVYASLQSSSSPAWILLISDPAAGLMSKSLYSSGDDGKSWAFITDVSLVIDGYVTGISFRSPNEGWITASQHGTIMLPLYRTKDGGKTWTLQNIPIPEGYKYGNAYPPVFDVNNTQFGTLKIEFVSDTNRDVFEFITNDGGETWNREGD